MDRHEWYSATCELSRSLNAHTRFGSTVRRRFASSSDVPWRSLRRLVAMVVSSRKSTQPRDVAAARPSMLREPPREKRRCQLPMMLS
jgi:hypothetical protein